MTSRGRRRRHDNVAVGDKGQGASVTLVILAECAAPEVAGVYSPEAWPIPLIIIIIDRNQASGDMSYSWDSVDVLFKHVVVIGCS